MERTRAESTIEPASFGVLNSESVFLILSVFQTGVKLAFGN